MGGGQEDAWTDAVTSFGVDVEIELEWSELSRSARGNAVGGRQARPDQLASCSELRDSWKGCTSRRQ